MIYSIIRQLFSGGEINASSLIIQVLVSAFAVFCILPIHEFAHAFAAYKLGDNTPKFQGRLTINPLAHLDLIGAVMIMLFGFGYAKPVGINPFHFKNRKRDTLIVALAGPGANLLMAFLSLAFMRAFMLINSASVILFAVRMFFYYAAYINASLAVFNLIPIPPLDGSKILSYVIPESYYYRFLQYQQHFMMLMLLLLFTGALTTPLQFLTNCIIMLFKVILHF